MGNDMQQKVALKAMTLRGVGSYLKGARLEIRPLTILCGKNGSGKSTWLRMLYLLRDADPFFFGVENENDPSYGPYTNALVRMAEIEGERKKLASYEENLIFGPLGAIGVEFEATEDLDFGPVSPLPDDLHGESLAQTFLWKGKCPKGTKFRLQMAHPQKCWADD
jgi:hypothetical protein